MTVQKPKTSELQNISARRLGINHHHDGTIDCLQQVLFTAVTAKSTNLPTFARRRNHHYHHQYYHQSMIVCVLLQSYSNGVMHFSSLAVRRCDYKNLSARRWPKGRYLWCVNNLTGTTTTMVLHHHLIPRIIS